MIIDFHTHLGFYKMYPKQFIEGMIGNVSNLDNNQIFKFIKIFLKDKDGTKLLKQMDEAEISKSVLLIIDAEFGLGKPEMSIQEIYKIYFKLIKNYPNRFIVFAGIDPKRGDVGIELFKKSINKYGFKGLKLYPPMGFSPKSSLLDEYFKICTDQKLTVLIHSGPSLPTMENQNSEYNHLYDAIKNYNDITFVLAHAGYLYSKSIIEKFLPLTNVYFDISGFQSTIKSVDRNTVKQLEHIFEPEISSRILFGSDWPLFNLFSSIKQHIKLLQDIFNSSQNFKKDNDALNKILFKNANKLLN